MEKPTPKQQAQPTRQDPIKQAEEESARECQEAFDLTPHEYHRFITLLSQRKKVGGSREKPIYAYVKKPYMRVDGRIQMAVDEATMAGRTIKVETEIAPIGGKTVIIKTVHTERGTASSMAEVNFGGKGVDETSPIENSDTSALGRALGQLAYGIIGGMASAEEVEQAISAQGNSNNDEIKNEQIPHRQAMDNSRELKQRIEDGLAKMRVYIDAASKAAGGLDKLDEGDEEIFQSAVQWKRLLDSNNTERRDLITALGEINKVVEAIS